jgi:hypothetical protein
VDNQETLESTITEGNKEKGSHLTLPCLKKFFWNSILNFSKTTPHICRKGEIVISPFY